MIRHFNEHGQPIGAALPGWQVARHPGHTPMDGRYCRLEPLDAARHSPDLFAAFSADRSGAMWTYMPDGPFAGLRDLQAWAESAQGVDDQPYFAIIDQRNGTAAGIASYMRLKPAHGVIEVGGIAFAPALQKSRAATEAMFLMMSRVFNDLGYRRYEWKCDALNAASRRAAQRFGFTYEGQFRQAIVYKGRNRDTAWFSILDSEWTWLEAAYHTWLDPANFTPEGQQHQSLSQLVDAARAAA
jgi:RimJ/RimL family protein N-acetyltransferase